MLAAILMDNHALNACLEILKPEDFYKEAHKIIFESMIELNEKNEPTDLVTLNDSLQKKAQLEAVGGTAYLSHLVDSVPTASHVATYARLIREKSLLRQLIHAASCIVTDCYNSDAGVEEILDRAENRVFSLSEKKATRGFSPVKDLVKETYELIESLYEHKSEITGLTTGFADLDKLTAGLQKGDLIIVAGRPSMGKTAFALNLVENAARQAQAKVAVFSFEMSKQQLVMRLLTSQARIDSMRLRTGLLNETDWEKLIAAADQLAHMQVYIDDKPAQTALEVRAKARRLSKDLGGLDLIVVDYLQLMASSNPRQSREQEIAEISRALKSIAKELNVPLVALSQLNRSLESRNNKRPMMSDLRESGAIEQDADVIAFIYRDEVYDPESPDKGVAEIIIGKQRNGATGMCRLAFLNQFVRFEPLAYNREYSFGPGEAAASNEDTTAGDVVF